MAGRPKSRARERANERWFGRGSASSRSVPYGPVRPEQQPRRRSSRRGDGWDVRKQSLPSALRDLSDSDAYVPPHFKSGGSAASPAQVALKLRQLGAPAELVERHTRRLGDHGSKRNLVSSVQLGLGSEHIAQTILGTDGRFYVFYKHAHYRD